MKTKILCTIVLVICTVVLANDTPKPQIRDALFSQFDVLVRDDFCYIQNAVAKDRHKERTCSRLNSNYPKFFLSLFVICGWGAAIRTVLRSFKLSIPYTVVVMLTGLIAGLGSRLSSEFCETWSVYTKIARTRPEIILFVFLPVLIFDSAFQMKSHIFMRSLPQILILALPGMLLATFTTAVTCQKIMPTYNWTISQAALFGSIISATDPVAVVAILGELGTSETLSVIIEGESLLNDGVAILLYDIFKTIVENPDSDEDQFAEAFKMFLRITVGGPIFGWVMARVAIFCLSKIFNDAATEITITLGAAYLTYFLGEHFLKVSGVMAVVILGITMNSEKTSISPEVQKTVHHFWEMLNYLANTILFFIVGVVITETAINSFDTNDGIYAVLLYIVLTLIRLLMICLLSPVLSRLGYGISWKNLMVMTWGGLRGAVGMCLALEVFKNKHLCHLDQIGPKFLLQTAGIVLLTLLLNGTTTKMLLDALKVTELSVGKRQDMANAVKQMQIARERILQLMPRDFLLGHANFDMIEEYTAISDPYTQKDSVHSKFKRTVSKVAKTLRSRFRMSQVKMPVVLTDCTNMNPDELQVILDQARLRILKAIKISCWRQYEKGVLSEQAVQILNGLVEVAMDAADGIIYVADMKKYWKIRGLAPKIRKILLRVTASAAIPSKKPDSTCRGSVFKLVTNRWFEYFIYFVILLNMIPVFVDFYYYLIDRTRDFEVLFIAVSLIFVLIYMAEFILKLIGLGPRAYFRDSWNTLDFIVLVISVAEVGMSFVLHVELTINGLAPSSSAILLRSAQILKIIRVARLTRIVRTLRWARGLLPLILAQVDNVINVQLFLGYDVGKGFVNTVDDVVKFLPQMVENPQIQQKMRDILEAERLETVREMGLLQREFPMVAIGVKTRHASRVVLNQMRDNLHELKEDGLIAEKEFTILELAIEENMKRLWESPANIPLSSPEMLIENVSWVMGSDEIKSYILDNCLLLEYDKGSLLCLSGEPADGVYIIVSGLIRIHYEATDEIISARQNHGIIPNTEMTLDPNYTTNCDDFFSTGIVLGEIGVLTRQARADSISCETAVTLYHVSQDAMLAGLEKFKHPYDSLLSRMWRACGRRIAAEYLPTQPAYYSWTADKIRAYLERSSVPVGDHYASLSIPEYVTETILIFGQLIDEETKEVYTAPYLIPEFCTKIARKPNAAVVPYFMIIADEEEAQLDTSESCQSLKNCVLAAINAGRGASPDDDFAESSHPFVEFHSFRPRAEAEKDHHKQSFDMLLGRSETQHQGHHPHHHHQHHQHHAPHPTVADEVGNHGGAEKAIRFSAKEDPP